MTEKLLPAPGTYPLGPEGVSVLVEDHELSGYPNLRLPRPEFSLHDGRSRAYLTNGLARAGQREVMFALAPLSGLTLELERDVLNLLRFLHERACEGKVVDSANITVFGEQAPFGLPHCGVVYLDPVDGPGPAIPENALLGMLLRPEECAAARIGGGHRVAAWIANAYRLFPYPKFSDPARPTAIPAALGTETILSKLPLLNAPRQASAFLENKTLTIRLAGNLASELGRGFARNEANPCFGILTGHVPGADGRLVWSPKKPTGGPAVIGPEGSSLSLIEGGFVALVGAQATDTATVVEDGFCVFLSRASWVALQKSVSSRTDAEIPMAGDEDRFVRRLRIECR